MTATQYNLPLSGYGIGEDSEGRTWLVGKVGDEQVGVLVLKQPNAFGEREVFQVWTDKEYRGIGVASHLWKIAQASKLNPKHDTHQTEDGKAWAAAVENR